MSLFIPAHKKTYVEVHKQRKKKKKKRRKNKSKDIENIYYKQIFESQTEALPNLQENLTVNKPLNTDRLVQAEESIEKLAEKDTPKIEEVKLPSLATFYDHLHMFAKEPASQSKINMVGKKAKLDFIESYKHLNSSKYSRYSDSKSVSPVLKYLHKIEERHLAPMSIGVYKRKGNIKEVNIGMYSIGNRYAEALSEGLHSISPHKVQLNDNRLSEQGISSVISSLNVQNLLELNLSNNRVSTTNLNSLSDFVSDRLSILKILNLEGLNLRDSGCVIICKALKKNKTLLELNLAKNMIEGNKTLSSYINQTSSLQKLDLHWNLIRNEGAKMFCQALLENKTLKVLDLSWNSLNSLAKLNSVQILAEALEKHCALIHVDISNNCFSATDSELIAKGLENNHIILGIHMSGNHASVNELGFVSGNTEDRPTSAVKFKRIMGFSRVNSSLSWRAVSNCWICERWSPVTFEWTGERREPVYLHLSFDDFDGELLDPPNYQVTRMCPPGLFYYIFSLKGSPKTQGVKEKIPRISKEFNMTPDQKVVLSFDEANVVRCNPKGPDLLSVDKEVHLPRIPLRKYLPHVTQKAWSITDSIFKDYKLDSPELLLKCFEYDWSRCKVPRLVKDLNELQKIKNILSSRYKVLKEIYKYYSSISPAGEIWSIGQMVFTDICNESKIVDNTFRLADIDFHLKGALFQEVRNPRSPPNSLIRFQFVEILVRIALDKFFKTGVCNFQSEAVALLIDSYVIQNLGHVSAQIWRDERYFYMSVETVIKANMSLLQYVYSGYSKRKVKPGQRPFMCLDEFNDLILKADLLNDNFTAREIAIAFNLAMMTQVQELDTDRQYQMSFIEFMEAISRVADMVGGNEVGLAENLTDTLKKIVHIVPFSMQKELSKGFN